MATATGAIDASYAANISDEFIVPCVIGSYTGMRDGDGVLMGNFRTDRAREILTAVLDKEFKGFARSRIIKTAAALGMVEYSSDLNKHMRTLFASINLTQLLGEVVSAAGLKQLRAAENGEIPARHFFL